MGLILIEHFPTDPLARQLQAYLAAPPDGQFHEFPLSRGVSLVQSPGHRPLSPSGGLPTTPLGTGTVFMRSGWPSGPADTDPSATYLTFQSGDHFSYHQHYDQNSFTLFKYGDLAVDSGVYSGDGLSYHDHQLLRAHHRPQHPGRLQPGGGFLHRPARRCQQRRRPAHHVPGSRAPGRGRLGSPRHPVRHRRHAALRGQQRLHLRPGRRHQSLQQPGLQSGHGHGLQRQRGQGEPFPAGIGLSASRRLRTSATMSCSSTGWG